MVSLNLDATEAMADTAAPVAGSQQSSNFFAVKRHSRPTPLRGQTIDWTETFLNVPRVDFKSTKGTIWAAFAVCTGVNGPIGQTKRTLRSAMVFSPPNGGGA